MKKPPVGAGGLMVKTDSILLLKLVGIARRGLLAAHHATHHHGNNLDAGLYQFSRDENVGAEHALVHSSADTDSPLDLTEHRTHHGHTREGEIPPGAQHPVPKRLPYGL